MLRVLRELLLCHDGNGACSDFEVFARSLPPTFPSALAQFLSPCGGSRFHSSLRLNLIVDATGRGTTAGGAATSRTRLASVSGALDGSDTTSFVRVAGLADRQRHVRTCACLTRQLMCPPTRRGSHTGLTGPASQAMRGRFLPVSTPRNGWRGTVSGFVQSAGLDYAQTQFIAPGGGRATVEARTMVGHHDVSGAGPSIEWEDHVVNGVDGADVEPVDEDRAVPAGPTGSVKVDTVYTTR